MNQKEGYNKGLRETCYPLFYSSFFLWVLTLSSNSMIRTKKSAFATVTPERERRYNRIYAK